jgi:REP element-mobilizing transposase RayT
MKATNLFKEKYQRNSPRLEGFDYGTDGAYLITICSKDKALVFSEIINTSVHLTELGKIVDDELGRTNEVRKYATVSEWIIMPNHIHCIIFIHKDSAEPEHLSQQGTYLFFPDDYHNKFGPQRENLASIVRGIKSAVTNRAKKSEIETPIWQANYYERIIRNEKELNRFILYIKRNPSEWIENTEFPEN